MNNDLKDFKKFIRQRRAVAAVAYVNGDVTPLRRVTTKVSPATFFGPMGGTLEGAGKVFARYDRDAGVFATGSRSRFEILQMNASHGLAFWTGFQRAVARLRGKKQPVPMNLRITEVFRRERGEWKLVHRHADMLAVPSKPKK